VLPRAGGLHILGQTSLEAAVIGLATQMTVAASTASNSIDMDPFLVQTVGLSSDYDAVHFGGDLVREEDENTWNGSPSLIIADWSLKRGACVPSLVINMVISHRALLNALIRSPRAIESYPHWSS
jgi:hypothetical protein